jgi:hypothetical protein
MLRSLCHVTYAERTAEAAAAAVAAVAGAGEVVQYPSARPAPPPAAVRQPAAACTRRTPPLSPEQPNAYSYSSFFSPAHSIDRSVQGTAECAFDQLISQTRFPTCHSDSAGLISDQSRYTHIMAVPALLLPCQPCGCVMRRLAGCGCWLLVLWSWLAPAATAAATATAPGCGRLRRWGHHRRAQAEASEAAAAAVHASVRGRAGGGVMQLANL